MAIRPVSARPRPPPCCHAGNPVPWRRLPLARLRAKAVSTGSPVPWWSSVLRSGPLGAVRRLIGRPGPRLAGNALPSESCSGEHPDQALRIDQSRGMRIGVREHPLGQVSPHWGRLLTCPNAPFPTPMTRNLPQCGPHPPAGANRSGSAHGRWRTSTQGHAPTLHNHRTSPAAPGQPASSAPPATWAPSKPVRTRAAAHPIAAATDTTPVPAPGRPRQPPTLSMTGSTPAPAHPHTHTHTHPPKILRTRR